MRSARITRPSTTLGNGSLGIGTRSCTTNGSVSATRTDCSLVAREQSHIPLVTQHRQARFLVEQFAAKGIHHTHRAGLDGADHRVIEAAPFHELADEDALVDQVNRLAIRHETTVLQLGFPRVDYPRIE